MQLLLQKFFRWKLLLISLIFLSNATFAASVIFPSVPTFGQVAVGTSKTLTFTVTNNTSSQVRLDSYWYTNSNPYKITGGTCGFNQTTGFILGGLKSCTLNITFTPNKVALLNNTLVVGYFLGTGWTWQQNNLALTGSGVTSTTTTTTTPLSCTFNGTTILSGASTTAYSTSTVAYGQACVGQTRTCTNGVLSGTYTYSSCTVAPAPTPTPTTVSSDMVFPADNPWNQDISAAEVDTASAILINTLNQGASFVHPAFGTVWDGAPNGIPYIVVPGTQPKVPVSFDYRSESDPGPYPIPANPPIEGGPNGTGDRHVIVVDKDNHLLYELYNAYPDGLGGWKAGSGAIFDLTSNNLRPLGWTSADAAGLPIYPGLVRYDEVVIKKEITHALRFGGSLIRNAFVYPARHSDGLTSDPSAPPLGMRVRLKASFDISKFPANVQVILRALKKYGMFLADTGTSWMISGAPDSRWSDVELHTLESVPGSAFEVIKMGTVTTY